MALFRKKALASQGQRLLGDVILLQPPSHKTLALALTLFVCAFGWLLASGSYARKERVSGYLVPENGSVRIRAPRAGVVDLVHAVDGQYVEAGATLVTLRDDPRAATGSALAQTLLRTVRQQLAEVGARKKRVTASGQTERRRLDAEIEGIRQELAAIDVQIRAQEKLLRHFESNDQRLEELVERGYVSRENWLAREAERLTGQQRLASLRQNKAAATRQSDVLKLTVEALPLTVANELSDLNSEQAVLERKIAEYETNRLFAITAPVAGRVTAISIFSGQAVGANASLMTLLPAGSDLVAQLYVPTRAAGFVTAGQDVRLLYDAFDFRRFGSQQGVVDLVSTAVFLPGDVTDGIQLTEPAYRITVRLANQSVQAYGQHFALQAGMTLGADIVLQRRSLIRWLFDPLYSLVGRA